MAERERRLTTIVAIDVAGYSRLMHADEAGTLDRLKQARALTDPIGRTHGGRIVGTAGDGLLLEFPSVVEAVSFAVEAQATMAGFNANLADEAKLLYRIGINLGDVMVDGDDLYGDGVNVAARLEALAEPGGICLSRTVRDHIRDRLDIGLDDLGEVEVKNIARPVRVFRVLPAGDTTPTPRRPPRRLWLAVAALVLLVALLAGGGWWWWQGRAPAVVANPSVAVLAFTNLSDDASQEYFADGMAEDIITDLSKLAGLQVISRSSSFSFKSQAVDVKTIGKALGAHYVVEGSVRRAGAEIRITAQLIDAATGLHLWADHYDGERSEVFKLQDQITHAIVNALAVTVTNNEQRRLDRRPTNNPDAYDLYLRGRAAIYQFNRDSMLEALRLSEQAIAADPDYADAYALDARAAYLAFWLGYSPQAAAAQARAARSAARALELDPENGRALSVQARLLARTTGDMTKAIELDQQAVALQPGNAMLRNDLAGFYAQAGRAKDALREVALVIRATPCPTPGEAAVIGRTLYLAGDAARAIEFLEAAHDGLPETSWVRELLAAAYVETGQMDKAKAEIKTFLSTERWRTYNLHLISTYTEGRLVPEVQERYLRSLKAAGLPEWPFGFEGKAENQLGGDAIQALLFGHVRIGQNSNGPYEIDIAEDGTAVLRQGGNTLDGRYWLDHDSLCYSYPWMPQPYCGLVFRNPDGNYDNHNEYVFAHPDTISYFSIKR